MGNKELSFTLTVKQTSEGIEHTLEKQVTGYSRAGTEAAEFIIDNNVAYMVEDLRRRVTRL